MFLATQGTYFALTFGTPGTAVKFAGTCRLPVKAQSVNARTRLTYWEHIIIVCTWLMYDLDPCPEARVQRRGRRGAKTRRKSHNLDSGVLYASRSLFRTPFSATAPCVALTPASMQSYLLHPWSRAFSAAFPACLCVAHRQERLL